MVLRTIARFLRIGNDKNKLKNDLIENIERCTNQWEESKKILESLNINLSFHLFTGLQKIVIELKTENKSWNYSETVANLIKDYPALREGYSENIIDFFKFKLNKYNPQKKGKFFSIGLREIEEFNSYVSKEFYSSFVKASNLKSFAKFATLATESFKDLNEKLHDCNTKILSKVPRIVEGLSREEAKLQTKMKLLSEKIERLDGVNRYELLNRNFTDFDGKMKNWKRREFILQKELALIKNLSTEFEILYCKEYLADNNLELKNRFHYDWKYQNFLQGRISLNFYSELKEAYSENNQQKIAELCSSHKFMATTRRGEDKNDITVYALPGNNINAFAGVKNFPHGEGGTWLTKDKGVGSLPPIPYARVLANIMRNGYGPSRRPMPGSIHGIRKVGNMYFYKNPHIRYGGNFALVMWNCKDYCVFSAGPGEFAIISPYPVPPKDLKLLINDPNGSDSHNGKYLKELILELKRLKIKFQVIDTGASAKSYRRKFDKNFQK